MTKNLLTILLAFTLFISNNFSQNVTDWHDAWAPNYRNANAVEILPNNKFVVVGGWPSNDAISTISLSSDTGATWSIAMDAVNAELHDCDFTSVQVGYVVGNAGNVWKTTDGGNNWVQKTVSGNAGGRNYRGCHFFDDNTGVVVGGWESNDSIQTILKTTDGGDNWSVISDNLGPWLRAVHFVDASTGFAVGDQGTVLKTTDGGDNWASLTINGSAANRKFNDVHFLDANTGIAVGGWPDNDSIQTIIRTTDGGDNWSVLSDNLGSMLNGVYFVSGGKGYAVGDDGVILYSDDAGASWTALTIANNNTWDIRDAYFKNQFFGLTGGREGKLLWLVDETGQLALGTLDTPVSILPGNSVMITGNFDDNGLITNLELEYGTTQSYGTSVPMNPGTSDGSGQQSVSVELNGLQPNQQYYARMKMSNSFGTDYSNEITFYNGLYEVPNFNFEEWDVFSIDVVDEWRNEGVITKVTSHDGSYAARCTGTNSDGTGAILFGSPGDDDVVGGIPYTDKPDSISFWCDYDVAVGDSAFMLIRFKNGGNLISDSTYYITGTSNGWVNLKYQIDYNSSLTPDSLIIGFVNNNVFTGGGDPNNYISVDDVTFLHVTQQLNNNDMESWSAVDREKADFWYSRDDSSPRQPFLVNRTTDAFSGNYAIEISNRIGDPEDEFVRIRSGENDTAWAPSFPVSNPHETLFGYAKFDQMDNDTLWVRVGMFENGMQTGWGQTYLANTVSQFTLFEVSINYNGGTPLADSCFIEISIDKDNGNGAPGSSSAIIDNLSFGGIAEPVGLEDIEMTNIPMTLYPNPSEGLVFVNFKEAIDKNVRFTIYDITGTLVMNQEQIIQGYLYELDLTGLPPQLYLICVQVDNVIYTFKSIIK